MAVHTARKHQPSGRVDVASRRTQALAERDDLAAGDADIAAHDVGGGCDRAAADHQIELCAHRCHATSSNSRPQPLTSRVSTPATLSDFQTAVLTVS